ncbi:MAG: hypothetical protein N5P05_000872 [Chroococcopsis gigantea SAG 12.99]|jgi:hypothetical protein|nr:PAP/fibrillin family protein [Chlorogloea purpurea SAG 13.99]MDV2999266.1 hypothetical protein [Chroococcopsis gigantea SAG 12.99]
MDFKARLLEAVAGRNRGLLMTESDKVKILSAVEKLEDHNPNPKPFEVKPLLDGDWRLLFTTSRDILGIDRFPLFQLGQIYQCIRMSSAKLYNVAEIVGVPFLEGFVSVAATFEPVSDKRVNVKFERYMVGSQRLVGYQNPKQFIEALEGGKKVLPADITSDNPRSGGWLEVTYLDEDLRIGRGNQGSVFVLAKEK